MDTVVGIAIVVIGCVVALLCFCCTDGHIFGEKPTVTTH